MVLQIVHIGLQSIIEKPMVFTPVMGFYLTTVSVRGETFVTRKITRGG